MDSALYHPSLRTPSYSSFSFLLFLLPASSSLCLLSFYLFSLPHTALYVLSPCISIPFPASFLPSFFPSPLTPFPPFLPLTLPALPCLYLSMQAIEEDSSCADFYHNRALAYEKLGDDSCDCDYYYYYDQGTPCTALLRLHTPLLPTPSYPLILTSTTYIPLFPLALLLPDSLFLPSLPSTF